MPGSESGDHQRLAAILAADAAGYSRLMEADERATAAALAQAHVIFHEHVRAHHGRVVNTVGDSVLAVFETAAGAVTAAVAIQRALASSASAMPDDRRLRFRIGVHLGDVNERPDGEVYGDGVNIAARLQALASPGGIVVSEAVRGAVKARVAATFDDLGAQSVKNIAEPVRAFAVRDHAAPRMRAPASLPARSASPRRVAYAGAVLATLIGVAGGGWWLAGRVRDPAPVGPLARDTAPPVGAPAPVNAASAPPARCRASRRSPCCRSTT